MYTLTQETELCNKLLFNLNELISIDPKSLIRVDALGALNFEEGLPFFERTLQLFKELKDTNFDGVPFEVLNQLNSLVVTAVSDFNQIREFSLERFPNNTKQKRDELLEKVISQYNTYYNAITPKLAYISKKNTDFVKLENDAKVTLEKIKELSNEYVKNQLIIEKESKEILDSMRKAAGEAGVSQHAIFFDEEAKANSLKAQSWFKYTIGLAITTVLFAIIATIVFFIFSSEISIEKSIQLAIAKILVFSVLYYATIWCGKNYKAYIHNYLVNRHRQNALSTFQVFVKATDDESTKNAVLLKATESIFSLSNSGFIHNETEPSGSSQILEIVRSGIEKK